MRVFRRACFALGAAAAVAVVSACFAPSAAATNKQLWHIPDLDAIASNVASFPLQVGASDNVTEWNQIVGNTGPYTVLGFTYTFANPYTRMYDPFDGHFYSVYHWIWISPDTLSTFLAMRAGIQTVDPYAVARALMVLDHESQHQRLASSDEGRVNACALLDIPRLLTTVYGLPETITQTVLAAVATRVRVRYRVRVHHRWVYRHRYVTRTRQVDQVQTIPNPVLVNIVAAAKAFYSSQPAPYSTGTCW